MFEKRLSGRGRNDSGCYRHQCFRVRSSFRRNTRQIHFALKIREPSAPLDFRNPDRTFASTCLSKFELTENEIQYLLYEEILPFCKVVKPKSGSLTIKDDPSDDMFLRCSERAKAKALISGDHHLLSMRSHRNTLVLSPLQFLKKFNEELSS